VGEAFAIFWALFCIGWGFVAVCWPRQLWNWRYKWAVKGGGEPSRAAILMYRGGGVFLIIVGLVVLIGMAVYLL